MLPPISSACTGLFPSLSLAGWSAGCHWQTDSVAGSRDALIPVTVQVKKVREVNPLRERQGRAGRRWEDAGHPHLPLILLPGAENLHTNPHLTQGSRWHSKSRELHPTPPAVGIPAPPAVGYGGRARAMACSPAQSCGEGPSQDARPKMAPYPLDLSLNRCAARMGLNHFALPSCAQSSHLAARGIPGWNNMCVSGKLVVSRTKPSPLPASLSFSFLNHEGKVILPIPGNCGSQ